MVTQDKYIDFVTKGWIPKQKWICQIKQVKVAHEGASFLNKKGALEKERSTGFDVHATITGPV